jgi:hypothetical protein
MARSLHVYPKAELAGSDWFYVCKVFDRDTRQGSRFEHTIPAGVTITGRLGLLKICFDLTAGDSDTDQDVDDSLFVDVASGGPTNGETLWESWQTLAESKVTSPDITQSVFWLLWSPQNTARIRTAARRILINGRGWTVTGAHQHEGDGTVTEE